MNKEIVMTQSTQNIAKSTEPRKPSPVKQHYRKKRRKATTFAVILIIAVLALAGFMIYSILFKEPTKNSNSSDISIEEIYNKIEVPIEITTPEPEVSITVSVVGDCTLGTDENFNYSRSLNAYYEKYGPEYFLKNVKSIFESDDLTIANLEGTFTNSTSRVDKTYAFKGPAEFVNILTSSSVESVTVANNHSRDYGPQSLTDTKATLDAAGVIHFGYDETSVVEVNGIKVGLIGIYELIDHTGRAQQVKDHIAKVKSEGAEIVIVIFHWGIERDAAPNSHQTMLARLAIDEGADLVCGHHPHVLQGIEVYKGKNIVYSLGNFCFGGNSNPSDKDTMIFQQTFTFTKDGMKEDNVTNVIPCSLSSEKSRNNYQPTPAIGEEAARIMKKIEDRSALIPKP
jgi:poly-gamma-glutamate synthesis protein (capsule biosynthesis protein)